MLFNTFLLFLFMLSLILFYIYYYQITITEYYEPNVLLCNTLATLDKQRLSNEPLNLHSKFKAELSENCKFSDNEPIQTKFVKLNQKTVTFDETQYFL